MDEKKYVVPEGMLESIPFDLRRVRVQFGTTVLSDNTVRPILEAALRWLTENPIVPTEEQIGDIYDAIDAKDCPVMPSRWIDQCAIEWQRRMFLAPEPEVPPISDLVSESFDGLSKMTIAKALDEWPKRIEQVAIEAYRRGQKAGN